MTTKTGPNDAERVVWAIGKSFFLLHVIFTLTNVLFIYIGCILRDTRQGARWKVRMTRTGPNDTRRVVWATLVSFFFFLLVLLILTIVLRYYLYFKSNGQLRKVATTETGPNDASCVVWAI